MFTQCPKCSTVFRIREEQIARHKGLVRCGSCRETFNAAWNQVNDLAEVRARIASAASGTPSGAPPPPAAAARPLPEPDARLWKPLPPPTPPVVAARAPAPEQTRTDAPPEPAAPPALVFPGPEYDAEPLLPPVAPAVEFPAASAYEPLPAAVAAPRDEPLLRDAPPPGDEPDTVDTVEEIVLESRDNFWDKADPSPAPPRAAPRAPARGAADPAARGPAPAQARRQRALAWTAAAVVLLAVAIWQIGFFYFETLAQSPTARPVLEAFCAVVRCQVPARRQLSRIDVAGANVAYHEEIPGALKISVNLVNRAPFPQAEPTLQVTLTDKDAKVVGRRAYKAAEYRRERATLAPHVVTLATLELAAPPESAVGYEIELFD